MSATQCLSPEHIPPKKQLRSTADVNPTPVPTTHTISKFFQTSPDDSMADFQTPKKKIRPSIVRPKSAKRVAKKPPANSKRAQLDIRKAMKRNVTDQRFFAEMLVEHSTNQSVDPDHLQMALALSRSLVTESDVVCNEQTEFMSLDDRQCAYRETLKMFAYDGKRKPTDDYRLFGMPSTAAGRGRRQKWAVVNTALTRRDTAKQEKKFKRKIDHILHVNASSSQRIFDEIMAPNLVTSRHLARYYFPHQHIYRKDSAQNELSIDDFYVSELCEKSVNKCGCLLKKWSNIPGRDASPEPPKLRNAAVELAKLTATTAVSGACDKIGEDTVTDVERIDVGMDAITLLNRSMHDTSAAAATVLFACQTVVEELTDDIVTDVTQNDVHVSMDPNAMDHLGRESPDMFAEFEDDYYNKSDSKFNFCS